MENESRARIQALAKELLVNLDAMQLEVIRTHIAIHRYLLRQVAQTQGCTVAELGRMSFSKAAKRVYGGRENPDLHAGLKMLNRARNSVAHEEVPSEMFTELAALGRHIYGRFYVDNPGSAAEAHDRRVATLQFIYAWATNP